MAERPGSDVERIAKLRHDRITSSGQRRFKDEEQAQRHQQESLELGSGGWSGLENPE